MGIEELVDSYGTSYDALRLATGDIAEQLWLELGGPDDKRALEFAEAALDLVNAATADTALLVDTYVGEYAATVTGRPPGASPLDLAEFIVDKLRDTPGLDVYRRPSLEVRRLLAEGRPYADAMAQAGRRAGAMAETDIGLAHRAAAVESMDANPDVDGYRRTLTGKSCLLCMVASTQRYRNAELMPIHTRCDCRVAPLVAGTDYGRVINRELYRELKSSGELARLNRANRGTSGQSRARAAERRRAQQSIDGIGAGNQGALDLRRPANAAQLDADLVGGARRRLDPSPAIRQHGELGPVLVDERHNFTRVTPTRAGEHRLDRSVDELRATSAPPPAKVTTQKPAAVADTPGRPPRDASRQDLGDGSRRPRYSADSPEVLRAAARRNLPPERVAAELNEKARRRAADAAELRAEARDLTVDHPRVIAAADKYGVRPDDVLAARPRVREVRRAIAEEATRVQAAAFGDLDQWDTLKVTRPPRSTARTAAGAQRRRGEYDWLERLDERERARLSRAWYTDSPTGAPDLIGEELRRRGLVSSDDEAIALWLDRTRTSEAAGALRRGRLPSERAYSGELDVDRLLPGIEADGYSVTRILGDDLDAAGHIAAVERRTLQRDAEQFLGAGLDPELGPPAYRMSFQTWQGEVADLEHAVRYGNGVDLRYGDDIVSLTADEAVDRLAELVPYYLDEPGTTFEELYTRIIATAGKAGREVPDYVRIPW